jgi:hypothetical protein
VLNGKNKEWKFVLNFFFIFCNCETWQIFWRKHSSCAPRWENIFILPLLPLCVIVRKSLFNSSFLMFNYFYYSAQSGPKHHTLSLLHLSHFFSLSISTSLSASCKVINYFIYIHFLNKFMFIKMQCTLCCWKCNFISFSSFALVLVGKFVTHFCCDITKKWEKYVASRKLWK